MFNLIRVSRDGTYVITKQESGDYSLLNLTTNESTVSSVLSDLTTKKRWRRPTDEDVTAFGSREVTVERSHRMPKALLTSLSELTTYDALNEETKTRLSQVIEAKAATPSQARWMNSTLSVFNTVDSKWFEKVITAAGFEPSDSLGYFGAGDDQETEEITTLIAITDDDTLLEWDGAQFVEIGDSIEDYDRPFIIELDEDTAKQIADWITNGSEGSFILDDVDDEELALFQAAESEIDWGFLDTLSTIVADATGYSSLERSKNASSQRRGPGGTFAPSGRANITSKPQTNRSRKLSQYHRARLKFILPLILDPDTSLKDWIAANPALWNVKSSRYDLKKGMKAAGEPVEAVEDAPEAEASDPGTPSTSSLYFAIVDPEDNTAVFDVVAIQGDAEGGPVAWKRVQGQWVDGSDFLADFEGATPPPVVQLNDEETVKDVLAQIDQNDADNPPEEEEPLAASAEVTPSGRTGYSMPDGAFLIEDEDDLKVAVQSYKDASLDDASIRNHIRKRAKALNRVDLLPEEWKELEVTDLTSISAAASPLYGQYGEVYSLVAAGVPGVADTPGDMANVRRLKEYWVNGKGAAKIRWGVDGDLTRCHRQLSKYVPGRAWGLCQNYHFSKFGMSNYKKDN